MDDCTNLFKLPTLVLQLSPHSGSVGDMARTWDPYKILGLAENTDTATPNDVLLVTPQHYMQRHPRTARTPPTPTWTIMTLCGRF